MPDDDIKAMIELADQDEDGTSLNFTEFCAIMTQTPAEINEMM